jgi:hypothetical protein
MTEAEALESCTVYFRLPHKVLSDEAAHVSENLRKMMDETLESALGDPEVSASNEPAIQVL